MHWQVFCAAATGKHHLDSGVPCQDAVHQRTFAGGFAGVVCDGAGSASHAHEGAATVAALVADLLAEAAIRGQLAQPGDAAARGAIVDIIERVRGRLGDMALANERTLRDYACTLVACVSWEDGGCFVHIGDGYAIRMAASGLSVVSPPENGEYADETYFLTDERWAEHLRITALPAPSPGCLLGLMSDGTATFAVNRARSGFYAPFLDPILAFLRTAPPADANTALRNLLASEKTFAITGDDKTLLLALAG
jgi:hypothetical protein